MGAVTRPRRLIAIAPGWGSFDLSWINIQQHLQKLNFDVVVFNYEDRGLGVIEQNAYKVAQILENLRSEYEHVTFIGHSMGGLIGRYIIQGMQRDDLIDAYVSVGTPHRGTHLARVGNFRLIDSIEKLKQIKYVVLHEKSSALQMLPGSDFLNSLNILDWPERIHRLSFSAGLDWILLNNQTSRFSDNHVHVDKATHTSIMMHEGVLSEILGFFKNTVFKNSEFLHENGEFDVIFVKNKEKTASFCEKVQKTSGFLTNLTKNVILWVKTTPNHVIHKNH